MSTTLERIAVSRLCDEVVQQIEKQIVSGRLKPGEKLPSEKELSDQAGVGRRAIRDALKILETKGLIEVRMGSGAFVARNDFEHYLTSLSDNVKSYLTQAKAHLEEVVQFRCLIEGAAVERLAREQDSEKLDRLRSAVEKQAQALNDDNVRAFNRAHFNFHAVLVRSLGNSIVSMLHQQVLQLVKGRMRTVSRDSSVRERSVREHREICDAIAQGKPAQARKALDRHLSEALATLREK